MNADILKININSLRFQRNTFFALSLILSFTLLISLSMLAFKKDRILVVPAVVDREFWIDSNAVSSTYLEQFGVLVSKLILEKSPQSAAMQREIVLRHVEPLFAVTLKNQLIREEEILKKQSVSYIFFPVEVKVDTSKMLVSIIGDRVTYTSNNPVSTEREEYILEFSFNGTRLLLKSLVAKDKSNV